MPVKHLRSFTVLPKIPQRLRALNKLAYNLWYAWHHDAVGLFRRIDPDLWEKVDHSPVKMLAALEQTALAALAEDDGFLASMDRVEAHFDAYLAAPTWFDENVGRDDNPFATGVVAYFSAEFGIHESVPVYSGGLGVLSGDHLKSASDLGLPLVGIGLMYREGYFRQYLTGDGWQQERYPENDFFNLPLIPETGDDGPLTIGVPFPGREVRARIWRLQVGRVPLYLLDTNISANTADDRGITARLYGGDHEMRIKQELILGVGGLRALAALGKTAVVCHMNEGHSAFCAIERIRATMKATGRDLATVREVVAAGTAFTTHTPVPAGNDVFTAQQIEHYLSPLVAEMGLRRADLLAFGRQVPTDDSESFGMTVLALKLSNTSNGVSALHGVVSRKMWQGIWPELPHAEVPITSITNGIHIRSWVSRELSELFDRYLGGQWGGRLESERRGQEPGKAEAALWRRAENIPDGELWRTHERRRERLVAFARKRLRKQLLARNALPAEIARAEELLDPDALTIGFARRFATYKRGNLIFRNLERLAALVSNRERPVQFIYSGKAHPRDHGGKELIAEIAQFARRPELRGRVVFLEDYDMNVARYLVQGVDVWLNNPRRPLEASGTSGMKAAVNGGLNLSILDGWWCEGYAGDNGWAIGAGEEYTDLAYQDEVEGRAVYDLLEQEIVPTFYSRGSDGVPRAWVRRMKRSIASLAPVFNTGRMVAEYARRSYVPSARRSLALAAGDMAAAAELAKWRQRLTAGWPGVRVGTVEAVGGDSLTVGGTLEVTARIHLGSLTADDVTVQAFYGLVDNMGDIPKPSVAVLTASGKEGGATVYKGVIDCGTSGQHGFAVRVLPRHAMLGSEFEPGLVCWG